MASEKEMANEDVISLFDACAKGYSSTVRTLVGAGADIHVKKDALWIAAEAGQEECLRVMLEISAPLLRAEEDYAYQALLGALKKDNPTCVALLLPYTTPRMNNMALVAAGGHGKLRCARVLVEHADPKHNNSQALYQAAKYGWNECVDLLYNVSDPFKALQQLQHKHPDRITQWGYLLNLCQRERLRAEVGSQVQQLRERKI